MALLAETIYWKIGETRKEQFTDPSFRDRFIGNLLGLSFMLTNMICSSSSLTAIHPMPNEVPVFKRETANNMYSPSAYFFGRFLSNTLIQLYYPITMILVLFPGIGIDTSFQNVSMLMLYAIMLNMTMIAQGYFFGVLYDNVSVAK